jgi:hypothetical protein
MKKQFKKSFFEKRDPEKKREEIRERINDLKKKIAEVTPEQLAEFSRCWVIGRINGVRNYSLLNYAIASFQLKIRGIAPTIFAPFKFWKEHERWVREGEKAVYIFAPYLKKEKVSDDESRSILFSGDCKETGEKESDEKILKGWLTVPVFDYNQTEGKDLEADEYISGGLMGDYMSGEAVVMFNDIVPSVPFEVETYKFSNSGENGWTDGRKLYVLEKEDDREMVSTLVHEWAHSILHFDSDRKNLTSSTKELEAETVAYVVCDCIGINSYKAPLYLKGWDQSLSGYENVRIEKVVSAIEKILGTIVLENRNGSETAA